MIGVLRMCVEVEDVKKGLESIDKEIQRLKEGRWLIERAWGHFKMMGKEDIADAVSSVARMVEKEMEKLERSRRVFEEELERKGR